MRSMTGFGYANGEANGRRCIVEMRSFNHRFFDLKLRLPTLWADPLLEQLIGQSLRKTVNRGSLIVSIREDGPMTGRHAVNVDPELGRAYGKALLELWQALRTNLGEGATEPAPDEQAGELGIETQHRLLTLVAAQLLRQERRLGRLRQGFGHGGGHRRVERAQRRRLWQQARAAQR